MTSHPPLPFSVYRRSFRCTWNYSILRSMFRSYPLKTIFFILGEFLLTEIRRPFRKKSLSAYIEKLLPKTEMILSSKIRILFVLPWITVGGADRVTLDLVSHLDPNEYDIDILTTEKEKNNPAWISLFQTYTNHIWEFRKKDCFFLKTFSDRLLHIKSYNYIIISNGVDAIAPLSELSPLLQKTKILLIAHGVSPAYLQSVAAYQNTVDIYVSVTDLGRTSLISDDGVPPERAISIYNGVDLDIFNKSLYPQQKYRPMYGIDNTDFMMGFLGRLSDEKHPKDVLKVAELLRDEPNIKFIIAGEGKLESALTKEIRQKDLSQTVFMAGAIDDPAQLLSEINVLYLCSDTEARGLVTIEAYAMGLPVVASAVGAIPEVVKNGENGFLISYDEYFIENSANAIRSLSKMTPDEIKQISQKNILAAHKLSLTNTVNAYNDLFHQNL